MVEHTCIPSIQETEAGPLQVQGQPGNRVRLSQNTKSWEFKSVE
jgi:hypothetical protein